MEIIRKVMLHQSKQSLHFQKHCLLHRKKTLLTGNTPPFFQVFYFCSSHYLHSIVLGYLKDSNAAAHSVDTGISQPVRLKRIENDIDCPIYMLESNNYHQSIERTRGNVVQKMIITTSGYQLWFSHSKLQEMIEIQIVYPYI